MVGEGEMVEEEGPGGGVGRGKQRRLRDRQGHVIAARRLCCKIDSNSIYSARTDFNALWIGKR